MQNAIKQAKEFGMGTKERLVPLVMFITELHAIGAESAKGINFILTNDWTKNAETKAWAQRFFASQKAMPAMTQAGVYSGVLHYLKAMSAAGTSDAMAVAKKMRELPVNDLFVTGGTAREDGTMVHDMFLARAKSASESTGPWDDYETIGKIPGDVAFRPLGEGGCPLTKH
jgi:branched-chain amino acid transport system substrate-binding protein